MYVDPYGETANTIGTDFNLNSKFSLVNALNSKIG